MSEYPEEPHEPLTAILGRVTANAREFVAAEAERRKLQAQFYASGLKSIALLLCIALFLLFGAIVALLVGLIFVLSPYLTPAGATGAVIGGTFVVILLLLMAAKAKVKALFSGDEEA